MVYLGLVLLQTKSNVNLLDIRKKRNNGKIFCKTVASQMTLHFINGLPVIT